MIDRFQEVEEKVNSYMSSPGFPWNFILEPVAQPSLEHYISYALTRYFRLIPVEPEDFLREEIRLICAEFLVDPQSKRARWLHGKHTPDFPFAFSQCMLGVILENLGMGMDQLQGLVQAASLLGFDRQHLVQKQGMLRNLILKHRSKAFRLGLSQLLGSRVISRDGRFLGILAGLSFDERSGYLIQLKLKPMGEILGYPRAGEHLLIPAIHVRLGSCYSGEILVLG